MADRGENPPRCCVRYGPGAGGFGRLAQLARALPLQGRGRRFESVNAHQDQASGRGSMANGPETCCIVFVKERVCSNQLMIA